MELNEIIERNYQATVKRGLINDETSFEDFIFKISEENLELFNSLIYSPRKIKFNELELVDIILVCLAMARHYGIDIQTALEFKTEFNEQRKD